MIEIGPHRFTTGDARATLRHVDDLFDVLVDGVPASTAALATPHRAQAVAALDRPLDEALRTTWAARHAAATALREAGAFGAPTRGRVAQLNTSRGGVPKLPVERVDVDAGGIVGDVQAHRRHHGRPWQALCLWSATVIDDLAAAGHPIGWGHAGENVTVADVDWARVRPGVVLDVGTVRCEVVAFAVPCAQNARWFRDGAFDVVHHRHGPVSRVYALVTRPGVITVGDEVVVMPA